MWRDSLKYDVVNTASDDKQKCDLIASFNSLEVALTFMKHSRDYVYSPFSWNGKGDLWDLNYNGNELLLFCDPKIYYSNLLYADEYPAGTTKEKLAKIFLPVRTFDYALPQTWLDEVSQYLYEDGWDEKHMIYRKILGGTVWFYPKTGAGSISGRPAVLTLDAYDCLARFAKR